MSKKLSLFPRMPWEELFSLPTTCQSAVLLHKHTLFLVAAFIMWIKVSCWELPGIGQHTVMIMSFLSHTCHKVSGCSSRDSVGKELVFSNSVVLLYLLYWSKEKLNMLKTLKIWQTQSRQSFLHTCSLWRPTKQGLGLQVGTNSSKLSSEMDFISLISLWLNDTHTHRGAREMRNENE